MWRAIEGRKTVADLKRASRTPASSYLATDEDREGEAISWHLLENLKPKVLVKRMVFHEITKDGHPRGRPQHPRGSTTGSGRRAGDPARCWTASTARRCLAGAVAVQGPTRARPPAPCRRPPRV